MQVIEIHYWAAARAAAGTRAEEVPVEGPITLADLRRLLAERHGPRLADVLMVCSVLLGDRPVRSQDPGEVVVEPGTTVEFLPPFAGG
ncbi:MoaD/ThiS family protein [Nocardioides sp. BGMRC 2183]|nr:MoaD/ThiS family protein [Nocardioides sp. BGMRC 2183]